MEYGQDGSLESRLYLTGAGKDDTGRLVFFLYWQVSILLGLALITEALSHYLFIARSSVKE